MNRTHFKTLALVLVFSLLTIGAAYADGLQNGKTLRVTITNSTRGQIFSPPIVISHDRQFSLFELGEPATPELSLLAEDGDPSGLMDMLGASSDVLDYTVADGPVLPGKSVTIEVAVQGRYRFISMAGMLVTTNDGFFAVRGAPRPWGHAMMRIDAEAYDAGSEANNEDCGYIPGPPCGSHLVRDTDGAEGFVHIHAGIHGGADLLPARDDWRNPVAEITLKRIY